MEISDVFFAIAIALIAISTFVNAYSLSRFMKDTVVYMKDNNANTRELLNLVTSMNVANREAITNFDDRLLSIERKMAIHSPSDDAPHVADGKFVHRNTL